MASEATDWKALPRPLLVSGLVLASGLSLWGIGRFVVAADATAQSLLVQKERNDQQDVRLDGMDKGLDRLTKTVDRMALDQACANLYQARRNRYAEAVRYFGARVSELGGRCE